MLNMESMRYRQAGGRADFRPVEGVIHPLRKIPTLMARNTPRQLPAFSPDGKRLLYVREVLWKSPRIAVLQRFRSVMRLGKPPRVYDGYEICGDEMIGDYLMYFALHAAPRYYGGDKIVFSAVMVYDRSSPEYDKYESHYVLASRGFA